MQNSLLAKKAFFSGGGGEAQWKEILYKNGSTYRTKNILSLYWSNFYEKVYLKAYEVTDLHS
jgi:hypothetical protein